MEQLFGFLIFVLLAVFSVASKVREQRKEEERRAQREREKKEERLDLPEATRRTLYGEPGIPTARPREAPPPVAYPMREVREQPAPARPIEAEAAEGRHGPVEKRRTVPVETPHGPGRAAPPATQPQSGRRPSSLEELFREMQRRVEEQMGVPQQQPQPRPQPRSGPRPQQRQRPQQQHSTASYEQARKQQQAERAQAMQRQHAPRPEAPQHAQRGGPARGKQAPTTAAPATHPKKQRQRRPAAAMLFRDLDDVRRGIIMSEILGTPRSLQPWP